jgi:hypothetical protein
MYEETTTVEEGGIEDFLAAVESLREEDETVRTTAHTSSVSQDGWAAEISAPR